MKKITEISVNDIDAYGINGQSAEQMFEQVKKAQASNLQLIFLFHGVGGGHTPNVDLAEHNKRLSYLKQNASEIWVAPLIDVARYVRTYQSNQK